MLSTEKVKLSLDRVEQLADDPAASPDVKMAAALLALGRGQIDKFIPEDPRDLDELLDRGSQWMQSLRSDPDA